MRLSIKYKILLSYLILAFLTISAVGLPCYFLLKNILLTNQQRELALLTLNLAERERKYISEKKALLESLSQQKAMQWYTKSAELPFFREFLTKNSNAFDTLSYLNEQGMEEVKVVDGKLCETYENLHKHPVVQEAFTDPNKIHMSVLDKPDDPSDFVVFMAIVKKSYFGDRFEGALAATIHFTDVIGGLRQIYAGSNQNSFYCVLNSQGKILFNVKSNKLDAPEIEEGATLNIPFDKLHKNRTARVTIGDQLYFASVAPISSSLGTTLFTATRFDDIMRPVQKMTIIISFIFLATISIIFLAASRMAHTLTKPIRHLLEATCSITKGDFKTPVSISTGDEIEQLGHSFDQMRENLRTTTVSKGYAENIFNSMTGSLIVLTPEGSIRSVNQSTCRMLGYTEDELIGRSFQNILCDKLRSHFREVGGKLSFHPNPIKEVEGSYQLKNGDSIPVLFSASVILGNREHPNDIVCIALDMTEQNKIVNERQEIQKQLAQIQKMESLGLMAGGVAHDFNNILCLVLGHAEEAIDEIGKDHPAINNIQQVIKGGKRAEKLVQQILMFSRHDPDSDESRTLVELAAIITECLKLIEKRIPANVELKVNLQSSSQTIADPTQIHQVILNLCTNAIYAMKEIGGVLKVELQDVDTSKLKDHPPKTIAKGKYLRLVVSDTGIGIPPDVLDRIFDPFFTTKPVGQGTGLGLSVAHGIVNSYGGEIIPVSKVGKGTTFYLYFPISS